MAEAYWRIRGYDPFFSEAGALEWAPPAHVYEDLYALYRDLPEHQRLLSEHPDWVLRDRAGAPLYIPADCDGETCAQYAADVGNAKFRSWWISHAQRVVGKGYAGIFIDDVNLNLTVSDGSGEHAIPTDPRTGRPMRLAAWRRNVSGFVEEIAAAFPAAEIVHNAQWFVGHSDEAVQRQVSAADLIELERGLSDPGLTGGTGRFSFNRLLDYVDWLHSRNVSVILEPYALTPVTQELELASYFLIRDGADAIASDFKADPANFSPRWDLDLGRPLGVRYRWKGLWRRDYRGGSVLVNPPDTVERPLRASGRSTIDGRSVAELTLPARTGVVLLGTTPLRGPAPEVSPLDAVRELLASVLP